MFLIFSIKVIFDWLSYFENRKIPFVRTSSVFGIAADYVHGRKGLLQYYFEAYNNTKVKSEPFFGTFHLNKPAIFLRDPELINKITRDSNYFINQSINVDEKDPLHNSLRK